MRIPTTQLEHGDSRSRRCGEQLTGGTNIDLKRFQAPPGTGRPATAVIHQIGRGALGVDSLRQGWAQQRIFSVEIGQLHEKARICGRQDGWRPGGDRGIATDQQGDARTDGQAELVSFGIKQTKRPIEPSVFGAIRYCRAVLDQILGVEMRAAPMRTGERMHNQEFTPTIERQ